MNLEPKSAKFAARALTAVLSTFVAFFIVFTLMDANEQTYFLPVGILISMLSVLASYPIYDKLYVYCQKPAKKSNSSVNTSKE